MNIEERLNLIESKIGLLASDNEPKTTSVESRLDTLLDSIQTKLDESSNPDVAKSIQNCNNLAKELSPSGLLLKSEANSHSSIYRKQEILARYEELVKALDLLAKIRDVLIISNPNLSREIQANAAEGTSKQVSTDNIISAPIISDSSFTFAVDPKNEDRMRGLTADVMQLKQKSIELANKVDYMLDRYYNAMTAINEKVVFLSQKEETR